MIKKRIFWVINFIIALSLAVFILAAAAEEIESKYPDSNKEIDWIVAFSAGGTTDLISRIVAPELSEYLGIPIIVRNIVGGNSVVAYAVAYSKPADGYTIIQGSQPTVHIAQFGLTLPYTSDDFVGIGCIVSGPGTIAVAANSPFNTLEELIEESRKRNLTVGTTGVKGVEPFMVKKMASLLGEDIKWKIVPYDSGAPQTAAMLGGHIDFAVRSGGWITEHKAGTLRILAVMAEDRIGDLPDVPTFEEITGYPLYISAPRGVQVRSDTPVRVIEKLRQAWEDVIKDNEGIKEKVKKLGKNYLYMNGEKVTKTIRELNAMIDEYKYLFE